MGPSDPTRLSEPGWANPAGESLSRDLQTPKSPPHLKISRKKLAKVVGPCGATGSLPAGVAGQPRRRDLLYRDRDSPPSFLLKSPKLGKGGGFMD
ncbi:uncharacterized protein G2W53_014562 [Senna tora]|uniref:Uncharacterized protein n=1 Tax=Senna tora TaxID=362788 RepID=A0A835C4B6_9FABA|nr:uncharacterized protein G2W53_014562 [Senna tora]